MKKETRTVVYDDALHIEAYRFEGIVQPFPNHFHEYYVIGLVEGGERALTCRDREYTITAGDVLLFNPGDNHACTQSDNGTLSYRAVNITAEVMLNLTVEITGRRELPRFSPGVIRAFTRSKGVTLYCYLENIRVGKAKKLLECGTPPIEAALQTGFSDQSHFTNYFSRLIRLFPGAYRDIFLDKKAEGTPHEA